MSTRTYQVLQQILEEFVSDYARLLYSGHVLGLLSPFRLFRYTWDVFYVVVQTIIVYLFKPLPPKAPGELAKPLGRIAVVGAGITGISSAAHAISHGFEVVIFETGSSSSIGGIWSNVNTTSGLQLNSLLYRFHPGVIWSKAFPLRDEILSETRRIWNEYHLEQRTRFNTKVTSVRRASPPKGESQWKEDPYRSRWLINNGAEGIFDAIIVNVGTCGDPNWIKLPGIPESIGRDSKSHTNSKTKPTRGSYEGAAEPCDSYASVVANGHSKGIESSQDPTQDVGESCAAAVALGHTPKHPKSTDHKRFTSDDRKDVDQSEETFEGLIIHSSQLDSPDFKLKGGERVVVIGSGASGVEAVETILDKFGSIVDQDHNDSDGKNCGVELTMIARNDKWIIPRNTIIDTCIAGQPFGRQMPLSFLWETFLKYWHYHGIEELAPQNLGIYEGTPVVNDVFLSHVKTGRCRYVRGSPICLTSNGVKVEARKSQRHLKQMKRNRYVEEIEEGEQKLIDADVIVLATGFKHPTIDFLPKDLFPESYQRPNLYLQNFSTEDWSILMTNSAYMNAIGTVGHFHIGIYTRILLTLLMDQNARPSAKDMKLWVDVLRFIKQGATGGALGFFTYMELTIWLILFHLFRPDRLKWLFFIMNGWRLFRQ